MWKSTPLRLLSLVLWSLYRSATVMGQVQESSKTCDAKTGTCGDSSSSSSTEPICSPHTCHSASSLYAVRGSGSAQAYKPNAPVKSTVCDQQRSSKYKVASTWRFSRRSLRGPPPTLDVQARVWGCASTNAGKQSDQCCCHVLKTSSSTTVEVWQARPDGTYSSIRPGRDEGDCRATLPPSTNGIYRFETLAPGSTGSLGGLGPAGFDLMPYGPPVLHMLVTAPDHEPLLVQVPVLMDDSQSFQGQAVMGAAQNQQAYQIRSLTKASDETVRLKLDLFLTAAESSTPLENSLCPTVLHWLPDSFFLEPIAVCKPSLLDFFPL